jgi:crossover junction endodeoxyribonuclease RuvC
MKKVFVSAELPIILGIDPGSRITGYAFVQGKIPVPVLPRDFQVLDAGVLRVDSEIPYVERIGMLHEAVHQLMEQHRPSVCVLEKAFHDKNASTSIKLGELRGCYIAACCRLGVDVKEITPAEVKKTLTGNGRSEKEGVALAIKTLMGFERGSLPHDVTDALAIALCYGLQLKLSWAMESRMSGVKSL